jgi:outer membrane protein
MNIRVSFALALSFLFSLRGQAQEQVSLEQVIVLALEKNYDVQLFKNLEESASTDNQYVTGAFLPQINATGSKVWNRNDQKQILANDSSIQRKGVRSENLVGSVQLTWTLFDGTKMFATRDRIKELALQSELNLKDQMVTTIADVITGYYDIVQQKQQLKAIQEQMSISEERVKLADRKLQVGVGGKPELLQARVDLNAQRTQVLQQEAAILQLKEQLNGLVAMQLPANFDVADTIIINLDLKQEDLSRNIENSNYGLLSAREGVEIARLSLHERRAERFPVINFISAYNFSRTENAVAVSPFTTLFNQNNGFNYGISVSLPILNGFNNRRLVQQANLTINRQQLVYDQLKVTVDVGLRNAYINYDNAKKILLIEEENIVLARENVFIAMEGFKRGVTTFIELRTAQQSLADAYSRLINARYLAKVAETELLRLNGGLLR